jgi:uncharacterized protein (TIRG00374 family)
MQRNARRTAHLVGWTAATILLIWCLRKVNAADIRAALLHVNWWWVALAIVANSLILASWSAMWWRIAPANERPRYGTMFGINAIASSLMNTVPFLGGHAAAVLLLIRRGKISRHGALSLLALDQLGEGMAKLAVFAVVAALAPIPQWMRVGIGSACIAVGALFVVLLAAAHGHGFLRVADSQPITGGVARARTFVVEWASRLETLHSTRESALALAFAIGTKVAEGAGIFAAQQALGVRLSFGATALVLAAVILGSMLPVAPGNIGTYETGAFLAYEHLGIDPGLATILAVLSHLCFMIPSIGIGYAVGSWSAARAVNSQEPGAGEL